MRRTEVPTPALLIDITLLDRNIAIMCEGARELGVALRPHTKTHKCVEIGQRLMAAGAIGVSCTTIGEAEAMALGGIGGILLTSPLTSAEALTRLQRLLLRGADIICSIDNAVSVRHLKEMAAAVGRTLPIIVDMDMGVGRTGCLEASDVVALAKEVAATPELSFEGVQAYWGTLQQITPFAERVRRVGIQADRLRGAIEALKAANLPPKIVTGAGTGSHRIDAASGLFTEIQPGSFLFLDSCYSAISISENENPFAPSLFVAAAVVSANRPGRVIVNAGWKAFGTDSGNPAPLRGAPAGSIYRYMGDEHGAVDFEKGQSPELGSIVEFLTSHCDPTVNLYSNYHVVDGDEVVDIWPIRSRY